MQCENVIDCSLGFFQDLRYRGVYQTLNGSQCTDIKRNLLGISLFNLNQNNATLPLELLVTLGRTRFDLCIQDFCIFCLHINRRL